MKPFYEDIGCLWPLADYHRANRGAPLAPAPSEHKLRSMSIPPLSEGTTKNAIVKIQIAFRLVQGVPTVDEDGDMLVHDKKCSIVCRLRKEDNPVAFARIVRVIRAKGVRGAKAYFPAQLLSKDVLKVKISEMVAEQGW